MAPSRIVVMGVAGSGKSSVAIELAARRGVRFVDADDLHSAANVAKMASGSPLTDDDRWPWLAAVREAMRTEQNVVVACSALKRVYRDALRATGDLTFVHLTIDRDEAIRRVGERTEHFMGAAMVDSQFAALEAPTDDEADVVSVDASGELISVVERVEAALLTLVRQGTRTGAVLSAPRSRRR